MQNALEELEEFVEPRERSLMDFSNTGVMARRLGAGTWST